MRENQKESWQEFRDSGLLWWTNRLLHTFGWSIVFDMDINGNILGVMPRKVEYRGFSEQDEDEGFIKLSKHMVENVERYKKVK